MNPIAENAVRVVVAAVLLAAAPAGPAAGQSGGAQAMPDRSGPWAFNRSEEGGAGAVHMAATPAVEDPNVWFLLVCDRARLAAAVMHSTGFSYAVAPGSGITLRFVGHPDVAAEALPVSENQLSIGEAAARALMPLVIESERVVASISDSEGAAHDYTFALQPNGRALAGIVRGCWDDR
jgi:hypothetical protein